mgnify:CR=1 FL=1
MENILKKDIENIKDNYMSFLKNKDEQSSFYIDQMLELFYSELSNLVSNKVVLLNLINTIYRKNIIIIFNNMNSYTKEVAQKSCHFFNEYINISSSNIYSDLENLDNLYIKFKEELIKNLNINEKIITLVSTNTDIFIGQLYTKLLFSNSAKIDEIVYKYKSIFTNELINNVETKKDYLLSLYRSFIDGLLKDFYDTKDEIKQKNYKLIINTSHNLLKEKEYININKYIDLNTKLINDTITLMENDLKLFWINKFDDNILRDYLQSFNNTLYIKIKDVFDEMNLILVLDNKELEDKVKKFNELITHIFEINLSFDKKFLEYKKSLNITSKNNNQIIEIINSKHRAITDGLKANLFNIFRENVKIYNDIVYKTLLLKSKVNEYNNILDISKIKDLLLK